MPSHIKSAHRAGWWLVILLAGIGSAAGEIRPPLSMAVVRAAAWSQGDPVREGAAELMILLEIARLRQESSHGGLIGVGDRRGLFSAGAEEALRHAVLLGIPVVKLAPNGQVLPAPHGLFLDGGGLSEEEARQVLAHCLARHGPLPAVETTGADAARLTELRARLQLFQQELTLAAGTRVAVR